MKKSVIIMMLTAVILTTAASAQKFAVAARPYAGHVYVRPHVTYVMGGYYHPFYRPYWYNPWYYPYPAYYPAYRPTKLDLQIEDIRNDYNDKIWSVRHNDKLSGKEKRTQVHELKHERDNAITEAKKNYYVKQ